MLRPTNKMSESFLVTGNFNFDFFSEKILPALNSSVSLVVVSLVCFISETLKTQFSAN